MLLTVILVPTALAMSILASPLNTTLSPSLSKRATPSFKKGDYTAQQIEQITKGHDDAIKMASTVVSWSTSPTIFDPIFRKFFNILDRGAVVSVFKQIIGKDDGHGHDLLGGIEVVKDWKDDDDNDEFSCTGNTQAELRDPNTNNPKLVVCDAGFKMGAIGKGWPGAPAVTCETFVLRISWKMDTIGFVLLHEYTHFDNLMSPVMVPAFSEKATIDEATGAYKVRRITRHQATWNADSYAWLAQEIWWTQTCHSKYGDFEEPEEKDN